MRLYLIRHGQTARNLRGNELIGQDPDEPLTTLGEKQALLLGKKIADSKIVFDEIYCSPYPRASNTCNIVLKECSNKEPIIDARLREYSTGEATNANRKDIITFDVLNKMNELGMHFSYKGGESLYMVEQRAAEWLFDVMEKHKNSNKRIAAFSHGMVIKCLSHWIMKFDQSLTWTLTVDNTSISEFEYKLGRWFVKGMNNTNHLTREDK